ncbi:serine hydrolase domain-containing protein [Paenibacillus illinoisensis]|uniref:serine hydrolase domain-containing protein n=1 Tax=Paenibacillus illinoisensis TaxID=59845 RepID=UPI00301CC45C
MNTFRSVIVKRKVWPPPEHMLFVIGSITKVFTSVILLEIEREKLLSPDDMVGKLVPNVKNDYLSKISLKNIATHTVMPQKRKIDGQMQELLEWSRLKYVNVLTRKYSS